ncbi:cell wall protein [Microbacterium aurantiacum]|uniref:cell wall protein n=1 Tax=Microbacterium aurantiacum TaxID=162393 RepID=UPI003F497687
MRRLPTFFAATTIAAVAALSVPAAAHASTIYPPSGSCTATPATATPGGTTIFACDPATFSANEPVTITVTGENGSDAVIGMIRTVSTASGNAVSAADGSLAGVRITFPTDARGTYNIAAFSSTSAGGTSAVSVTNPDGSLPVTGFDSATMTGLWVGGGLLLLAGVALGVVAVVRRRRDSL